MKNLHYCLLPSSLECSLAHFEDNVHHTHIVYSKLVEIQRNFLLNHSTYLRLLLLRKDRNLTKGGGLHWDVLLMGIITLILSALGLPWMCAAAVQSNAHVSALTVHVKRAPGQREGWGL